MAIKNKYSDIDLSKYAKGYQASKQVKDAQKLKTQAEKAVRNYGDFKYGNQGAYDKAMNDILNRKSFSYDLNGDALYQQYKDMYMSQGKLAMADTMGQAAALTGGYGNSYAASVGNQAYQGYLQQLNGVIPELYNLALSAYNAEGDRLNNNFNLLSTDRSTEYGEYTDKYNRLVNDRGYYSDNYNNVYNQDYSKWTDNRNYDQSQYWNEYNAGYQKDRDAIADAQWQKEYNLAVSKANSSGSGKNNAKKSVESVPDGVIEKLESMGSYEEVEEYLAGLRVNDTISADQEDDLIAIYGNGLSKTDPSSVYNISDYQMVNKGGLNWGGGIDENATIKKGKDGDAIRLDDFYNQLVSEGYTEDSAEAYIKQLQKELGITWW
jgi:hypothetical protein